MNIHVCELGSIHSRHCSVCTLFDFVCVLKPPETAILPMLTKNGAEMHTIASVNKIWIHSSLASTRVNYGEACIHNIINY